MLRGNPPPPHLFLFLPFSKKSDFFLGGAVEHPEPPPLKYALTFLYSLKYCTNITATD